MTTHFANSAISRSSSKLSRAKEAMNQLSGVSAGGSSFGFRFARLLVDSLRI
jgi:hypothetical protein